MLHIARSHTAIMPAPLKTLMIVTALCAALLLSIPAMAQDTPPAAALEHATNVSSVCPGQWEAPACLTAVSQSNLVMAANYAQTLSESGHEGQVETVKQTCAASTAASKDDYPAYAMKSAYIQCANSIVDITNATGVQPDASHYQILIGAVLCMEGDPRCSAVEQGLSRFQ